jgi:recombination protein RecA
MPSRIDEVQKLMEREFGPGKLVPATKALAIQDIRVPTNLLTLDRALRGGVPLGKLIEFSGPYSGGKTTVALKIAAEFQKAGKMVAFIDSEKSFDSAWAALIGVDIEALLIAQPDDHEEAIDMIERLIRSRKVGLIVLDSISGLVPVRVLERSAEDMTIGIEARLNNLLMRKIVAAFAPGSLLEQENEPWCSFIMINQLRANMSMYGVDKPSGGYGIKFFKHIGVEFYRAGHLGCNGEEIKELKREKWGQVISFNVTKNKTSAPWGQGFLDFYYRDSALAKAGEFDLVKDLAGMAVETGLIQKQGSWFKFQYDGEQYSCQGIKQLRETLSEKAELYEYLCTEVRRKLYGGQEQEGVEEARTANG